MKRFSYLPQRLLVLLIGVAVTEFGSQLFVALNVGADPFMILVQGISSQTGLSYGQASTILMLICLLGIFLFDKKIYLSRYTLLHFLPWAIGGLLCLSVQPLSATESPPPPHRPSFSTRMHHRFHWNRHFGAFGGRSLCKRFGSGDR